MKQNLVATTIVMAAVTAGTMFGQYRGNSTGRPPVTVYDNDDRRPDYRDPERNRDNRGYAYDDDEYDERGFGAPAPPPMPAHSYGGYRRPPMPGPGFVWVEGFWSLDRAGRYIWVSGLWVRPPYGDARWMAPCYERGRFFGGFWSAPHRGRVGFGFSARDRADRHRR